MMLRKMKDFLFSALLFELQKPDSTDDTATIVKVCSIGFADGNDVYF